MRNIFSNSLCRQNGGRIYIFTIHGRAGQKASSGLDGNQRYAKQDKTHNF